MSYSFMGNHEETRRNEIVLLALLMHSLIFFLISELKCKYILVVKDKVKTPLTSQPSDFNGPLHACFHRTF